MNAGNDDGNDNDGLAAAKIAQKLFEAAGGSPTDPLGPLSEWALERQLERHLEDLQPTAPPQEERNQAPSSKSADDGYFEAQEAQAEFEAGGGSAMNLSGPLFQWAARQYVDELGEAFKGSGQKLALFEALNVCAKHSVLMPHWAAWQVMMGYRKVRLAQSNSWDEVLGIPYGKGAHLKAIRRRQQQLWPVYFAVEEMLRKRYPKDDATFAIIAERMNPPIPGGGAEVKRLYYLARRVSPKLTLAERIIKLGRVF